MFLRSEQLIHPLRTAETWRTSVWRSEFCIEVGHTYQPHEPTTSSHEPARLSPLNA
jgi:hypothetical protein